jgi:eukaryotic-like serine/threonine-protein kinase
MVGDRELRDRDATVGLPALDAALSQLSAIDPALAGLVDRHFFGGISLAEIALRRQVSERTVEREWQKARLLLHRSWPDEDERSRQRRVAGAGEIEPATPSAIDRARWGDLSPLLDRLLETEIPLRSAVLREVRERDPALAEVAAELLARGDRVQASKFLECVPGQASSLPGNSVRVVGGYTLVRPLGQGGMGVVWLARRSDGRFEAQAAVKFPHFSLLQSDGLERFRREGHLLGRLTHANIARLIDAGVAPEGPYLVLEYVEGQAIDVWCDERALGVTARVQLFLDVLRAVAHAHAKLVLHRDIKPSNILVTAEGAVKLLDFGIAKLIHDSDRGAAATELTERAGRAFTPEYAAPEQMVGSDVTMATDVYALGVLLFKLLTGSHPIAGEPGSPLRPLQLLGQAEPRRLRDAVPAAGPELTARSAAAAAQLRRRLRGDLETIVGKALKKDPAQRYATTDAFASDLRGYLNREPVSARPDSLAYRTSRFVSRHRYGMGVACFVLLTLLGGIAGTWSQSIEARRERDRALAALARAEAASDFVGLMITTAAGADEHLSLAELLQRSEVLAMSELRSGPEQQAAVLDALASYYASLGNHEHAERLEGRASELTIASSDTSWRARVECTHAYLTSLEGKGAEAKERIARWISRVDLEPGAGARCEGYLARILLDENDARGALERSRSALARFSAAPRQPSRDKARLEAPLAYALALNGRNDEADRHYRAALDLLQESGTADPAEAIAILEDWAIASQIAGDLPRAVASIDEALRLVTHRSISQEPPAPLLGNRAQYLLALGRIPEAIEQADAAIAIAEHTGHKNTKISALSTKLRAHIELGELDTAERLLGEAMTAAREGHTGGGEAIDKRFELQLVGRQAQLSLARGDFAGAAATINPVIARLESQHVHTPALINALRLRAEARFGLGDRGNAARDALAALSLAKEAQGGKRYSLHTGLSWLLVARFNREAGDLPASRSAAESAVTHLAEMLDPANRDLKLARALQSE